MTAETDRYLKQRAVLSQMGEHWHKLLWDGDEHTGWDGDRFLNLYHHVLTDDLILKYEIPNAKPELVARIPLADFDIHKLTRSLARADNRKTSVLDKIAEVDAHNDKIREQDEKNAQERKDAAMEKLRWAMRKDTGNHIAPMTVPDKPATL